MPWRVLDYGGRTWSIALAAERRPPSQLWSLVLGFRPLGTTERVLWAPYPLESYSRSGLFERAETISDDTLCELLAGRLK